MNLHKSKKIELPRSELYETHTGGRKTRLGRITLAEKFLGGEKTAVEVTAKMIYDNYKGYIAHQHIAFKKIFDEQVKLYGKIRKVVQETIGICKDADICGK